MAAVGVLDEPLAPEDFGAKASALARLRRDGLPVPPGFCLSVHAGSALAGTDEDIDPYLARLGAENVAVRSSAIGEDGSTASFAGIFSTVLDVPAQPLAVMGAVREVRASAHSARFRAYQGRTGAQAPKIAVLVQEMISAVYSGVLFTQNPLTGAHETLIEASHQTGAVVEGRGEVHSLLVRGGDGGCGRQIHGQWPAREQLLDDLLQAAQASERLLGRSVDVEWAVTTTAVWILQARPITAVAGGVAP